MRFFSTSIQIDAGPAVIWQVLSDFEKWPQWTASINAARRLDQGAIATGSRIHIEQPKLRPAMWTITAWEPERRFTWISRSPGVIVTADHVIEPAGAGCRVTLKIHFGGMMGWLVGLIAGHLTNEYMSMEANGLKTRAETESRNG